MAPTEDFPHQSKADELLPQQQGEDLMGEDFLDNLVLETGEAVKSAIRGCSSCGPTPFKESIDSGLSLFFAGEGQDTQHI